jgi:hypothetical protein
LPKFELETNELGKALKRTQKRLEEQRFGRRPALPCSKLSFVHTVSFGRVLLFIARSPRAFSTTFSGRLLASLRLDGLRDAHARADEEETGGLRDARADEEENSPAARHTHTQYRLV